MCYLSGFCILSSLLCLSPPPVCVHRVCSWSWAESFTHLQVIHSSTSLPFKYLALLFILHQIIHYHYPYHTQALNKSNLFDSVCPDFQLLLPCSAFLLLRNLLSPSVLPRASFCRLDHLEPTTPLLIRLSPDTSQISQFLSSRPPPPDISIHSTNRTSAKFLHSFPHQNNWTSPLSQSSPPYNKSLTTFKLLFLLFVSALWVLV